MKELTEKQKKIWDYFHLLGHNKRKLVTHKEVANYLHITIPSIANQVELIRMKGYFEFFRFCPWCGQNLETNKA